MYCTPKVRHKTFGVFFMKYSYEQRLIIVSRVKQGELIAHLSKEYHQFEIDYFPSINTFIWGDGYFEISNEDAVALNTLLRIE